MRRVKRPVYAAMVNLGGLIAVKPLKCSFNRDLNSWWGLRGDLEIKSLGLDTSNPLATTFASYNKRDVKLFIYGSKALGRILKQMVSSNQKD